MLEFALPIALLLQATPVDTGEDDLTAAVGPAAVQDDVDPSELKRIYVADSTEATEVEVVHPLQDVCVRKLVAGSRVKARTLCQDQTSWIAYVEAQKAMAKEWADTARALRSDEMTNGAPAGRAYGPGG